MPDMLGFDVCKRLHANPVTKRIPVIFLTAMDAVGDKVRGFESGGVDFIVKPYSKEEVVARINTHLLLHSLQIELETRNTILTEHRASLEKLVLTMTETNGRIYEALRSAAGHRDVAQDIENLKGMFHDIIVNIESELRRVLLSHDGS